MRLRLWHAADGTRVAYREAGAGPVLVLVHSCLLTHREWTRWWRTSPTASASSYCG